MTSAVVWNFHQRPMCKGTVLSLALLEGDGSFKIVGPSWSFWVTGFTSLKRIVRCQFLLLFLCPSLEDNGFAMCSHVGHLTKGPQTTMSNNHGLKPPKSKSTFSLYKIISSSNCYSNEKLTNTTFSPICAQDILTVLFYSKNGLNLPSPVRVENFLLSYG